MTRTAFCRKLPRVPRVCWLGSWALGSSDRGGQDKARKVRAVGRDVVQLGIPVIQQTLRKLPTNLRFSARCYRRSAFDNLGAQHDWK